MKSHFISDTLSRISILKIDLKHEISWEIVGTSLNVGLKRMRANDLKSNQISRSECFEFLLIINKQSFFKKHSILANLIKLFYTLVV